MKVRQHTRLHGGIFLAVFVAAFTLNVFGIWPDLWVKALLISSMGGLIFAEGMSQLTHNTASREKSRTSKTSEHDPREPKPAKQRYVEGEIDEAEFERELEDELLKE